MIRQGVRKFYDSYGWRTDKEGGRYKNDLLYGDLSEIAKEYDKSCEARYAKYFEEGGRYFLDAGCGAQPIASIGQNFQRHVCADISLVGLIETRRKLGDRGLYVVADLSSLPFKEGVFDGIVASYCLYQLDKDSQYSAVKEFYRVVRNNKVILVFYVAKNSLVFTAHRIGKGLQGVYQSLLRGWRRLRHVSDDSPPFLHFCVLNPFRLSQGFPSVEIDCLRTLTRVESLVLYKLGLLGPATRLCSFLERKFPHAMLWIGQYATIRIRKTGHGADSPLKVVDMSDTASSDRESALSAAGGS